MIFEAIAAIKIANEAIGAIKEFAGHVQSVGEMGKDLTKLADAKEKLEKSAAEGDMDAFWTLEDIKRQEESVKNMFIYSGRAGLWEDYCRFIENRKYLRDREKQRIKARRLAKKKAIKNGFIILGVSLAVLTAVGGVILMVYWMVSIKGK
jgi:hypothetical protein